MKIIFILFLQDKLGLSEKTVIKAFKQLSETKLIFEKRQGLGKPNLIYVGKIQHENQENENKNLERTICLLQQSKNQDEEDLKFEYENKIDHIEHKYKKRIKELEKKNKSLNKVIDKFKDNLKKFLKWLCHKFSYPSEDELVRDFEKETYANFNFEKQLDINQFQKEYNEIDFEM